MSLFFILESWVLNLDLDSWDLESWILILDSRLSSWVLNSSWFLSWTLELFLIHLSCSLIDLWAFCHHLCHHLLLSSLLSSKHLWITFDSPWSFASTISPFLMMTTSEIKKHTLFLVDHSHKFSPFVFDDAKGLHESYASQRFTQDKAIRDIQDGWSRQSIES